MAKLVTEFKYLNSNRNNNISRYAKYIAAREGVKKIDDTKKNVSGNKEIAAVHRENYKGLFQILKRY